MNFKEIDKKIDDYSDEIERCIRENVDFEDVLAKLVEYYKVEIKDKGLEEEYFKFNPTAEHFIYAMNNIMENGF